LINIICDHALLTGFAENKPVVGPDLIAESVDDLHFPGEGNPLPVAASAQRGGYRLALWVGAALMVLLGALIWRQYFR
jgi:general secretion pathway protein A